MNGVLFGIEIGVGLLVVWILWKLWTDILAHVDYKLWKAQTRRLEQEVKEGRMTEEQANRFAKEYISPPRPGVRS